LFTIKVLGRLGAAFVASINFVKNQINSFFGEAVYRKRLRQIRILAFIFLKNGQEKLECRISKLYQSLIIVSNHAGLGRLEIAWR
jgi:hypothetical protein